MADNPVILIGGHGFLGRAFATHLCAAGREVQVIGRADWDSGRASALASSLDGRRPIVVDLAYATVPSSSFADPVGDFTANLGAIIRHLEFARTLGVERYLFVSSGGTVYGDSDGLPLPEDSPTRPISPYGITKLAGEHYALMFPRLGLPVMIARPSNIYGPGQQARRGQGVVAAAFATALAGRPMTLFGDGTQLRDYLYLDDFCAALDAILERGEDGATYNVGSGIGMRADEMLAMIGVIVAGDGHRLEIIHADPRPFDVDHNVLDSGRLAAATGWRATTDLAKGLAHSWRWMLGQ